jgi:hypothetical protein
MCIAGARSASAALSFRLMYLTFAALALRAFFAERDI